MAISDDFTANFDTGDIRHTSGTTVYSALDFHAWLQDLADDPANIDNDVPSKIAGIRDILKPAILTLPNSGPESTVFNIDDTAARFINFGSIEQDGADTLYTGLKTLGSPLVAASPMYVVQSNSKLTKFWPDGHIQILVKARTGGALIDSGDVTVYSRKYGQSYAHFDVNLAAGSEQPAAITTVVDSNISLSLAAAQTELAGITITPGDTNQDLGNGNGSKLYKGIIDCANKPLATVYQALMAATEEGSVTTIGGVPGWRYRALNAAYNEVTSAPFGQFAGGTFFVAQGWWLSNVPAGDAENYQLIADDGTTQVPPTQTGVTIGNLVAGDRVIVSRSATPGGAITKNTYTLAAGNNSGNGTIVINETIAADEPTTGNVRIGDDIYAYTSYTGSTFTLSGTLSTNYSLNDPAYVPLIDEAATGSAVSVSVLYVADRPITGYVRRGTGGSEIVSFPISGTMGNTPISIDAVRTSEVG